METSKLFRVDGMVAVVTGGGTGIGYVMAKALANAGARKVYILGRRMEILNSVAKEHPALVPLMCDVGSRDSIEAAVEAVGRDSGGYINLLVANSGIMGPTRHMDFDKPLSELRQTMFKETPMEDFTHAFHINTTGAYYTMLGFLELLDAGNKRAVAVAKPNAVDSEAVFGAPDSTGKNQTVPSVQSQVIFTSSIAAYSRDRISAPAYSGSKAAIAHLTKHAATNLSKYEIRVNALAPGLFPSEIASTLIGDRDPGSEEHGSQKYIPARRFGGEEEMHGTLLYLASRAGAFCNGSIMVMDGGRLSVMPSEY